MKITKREFIAGSFAAAGFANAQAPIVIKLSHVAADDTPKGLGSLKFKELAEKYSGGKVKVEVYPNSQLYKDKEEMDALQLGSVQILAPSIGKMAGLGVKEFEGFNVPFMFDDYAAVEKVTEGPLGKKMLGLLEAKGIKGLAYWENGFYMMSANKAIRTPADVKGLKMRHSGGKVLEAQWKALGALPQVLSFAEVYQALQTGVVDGTEGTPSNYYTQKFYEEQKFITLTYHNHLNYILVANKTFWDGLPPDVRAACDKAVVEATAFANTSAQKENTDALEAIRATKKSTIIELTPAERKAFKDLLVPVHKQMVSRFGQETLDALYAATGFKAN